MSRKHPGNSSRQGKRSLKPSSLKPKQGEEQQTTSSADPWAKASAKVGRQGGGGHSSEQGDPYPRKRKDGRPPRKDYRGGNRGAPKHRGEAEVCVGLVSAHPDGFGFVDVVGREKGVFLPHEEMRSLMHGDSVEVRVVFKRGRESGEYVRTVEEAPSVLTGQFGIHSGVGLVKPRSKKIPQSILIKRNDAKGAVDGDWVRIKVERGSDPLRGHI
ncbi:MAG: hypothetical protein R8K22_00140, partial [Mariprofundaceae bacterium]